MDITLHQNGHFLATVADEGIISPIITMLEQVSGLSIQGKQVVIDIKGEKNEQQHILTITPHTPITISIIQGTDAIFSQTFAAARVISFNTRNDHDKEIFFVRGSNRFVKEKPVLKGEFNATGASPAIKRFDMREITDTDYPFLSLADAAIHPAADQQQAAVKIIITEDVYATIAANAVYSRQYEEGGFFIGDVFREREDHTRFIIRITEAFRADEVGASADRLIFTGDSFSMIKKILREKAHTGKKLLGWYHTHLFPAGHEAIGLSAMDFHAHFTTFRFPWQVAGLINIENDNSNKLRFYARKGQMAAMEPIPYWRL